MRGVCLRFHFCEDPAEPGRPTHEWLLQHARSIGMPGASVFRAIAGFGRHGGRHEPRFGELPGSQAMLVEFLLSQDDARRLVDSLASEPVALAYAQWPIEFGLVGGRS
ncbi:MAG: DUF190 domain-containing protein [Dokdonella sp.]|uniref:DUF190 domain-containing protein n=1 Tax=Dokdonella sp. TaxID=2291710 RepID=UPI003F7E13EA